jgi:hypothetical protein
LSAFGVLFKFIHFSALFRVETEPISPEHEILSSPNISLAEIQRKKSLPEGRNAEFLIEIHAENRFLN